MFRFIIIDLIEDDFKDTILPYDIKKNEYAIALENLTNKEIRIVNKFNFEELDEDGFHILKFISYFNSISCGRKEADDEWLLNIQDKESYKDKTYAVVSIVKQYYSIPLMIFKLDDDFMWGFREYLEDNELLSEPESDKLRDPLLYTHPELKSIRDDAKIQERVIEQLKNVEYA